MIAASLSILAAVGWQIDRKIDPFTDKVELTAIGLGQSGNLSLVAFCHPEKGAVIGFHSARSSFDGTYMRGGPRMISIKFRAGKLPARTLTAYAYQGRLAMIGRLSNDFAQVLDDLQQSDGSVTMGGATLTAGFVTDTVISGDATGLIKQAIAPCMR